MNDDKLKSLYGNVIWADKPHNFLGLSINFTRYILTDNKLITRKGMLNIKEDEIEVYRIVDKKVEYSLGERIFRCGSIILHTKDSDTPTKELRSIKNPRNVIAILDGISDALKDKYGIRGKEMFGAIMGNESDSCGYSDRE